MQITDHESTHYGKRSGYLFWVEYDFTNQIEIDFADFAAYLVATGEFDGYTAEDDDGELWRYVNRDEGKCETYTFNEVIKEFLTTGDFDEYLTEYVKLKLSEAPAVLAA